MRKAAFIGLFLLLSSSCDSTPPPETSAKSPKPGFCGISTKGACATDADCMSGGCSNQICQSRKEEPKITTCEFRECYVAANYGLACGCFHETCQWH